jgi:hypothetical protein
MRRLLRHLFTLCAALSLLLCVAVCVLWVRSRDRIETVSQTFWSEDGYWYVNAATMRQEFGVAVVQMCDAKHRDYYKDWTGFKHRSTRLDDPDATLPWAFSTLPQRGRLIRWYTPAWRSKRPFFGTETELQLIIPMWTLAMVCSVLPAWWTFMLLRRHRRHLRAKINLCPTCGYDLRASPERCPECGTAVNAT